MYAIRSYYEFGRGQPRQPRGPGLRHPGDRLKLDACCQYGVDVDLGERDQILAHRDQIHAILRADVRDQPWFHDQETVDPDFPSGRYVRTRASYNFV